MKNILYLECSAGISGDMAVAALLDLGADREAVDRALRSIPGEFRWEVKDVYKNGIRLNDFAVILPEDNRDHDMEYLHGPGSGSVSGAGCGDKYGGAVNPGPRRGCDGLRGNGHERESDPGKARECSSGQSSGYVPEQDERTYKDILSIIDNVSMTGSARTLAKKIFGILARAESAAHGIPEEQVHFHEVGALDSIADIVALSVCFDSLATDEVIVDRIFEGRGMIRSRHGILPVPVPAVQNIVREEGLPLTIGDAEGEFVTPTGAAFLAAVRTGDRLPERFHILRTGLGAGKREYAVPGILRAHFIEPLESDRGSGRDAIWKIEANIDDSTGEELGLALNRLMEAGAKEVNYSPVFMKKNRPGWLLTVISAGEDVKRLEDLIFRTTSTVGIRRVLMERTVLPRYIKIVDTRFGPVSVKFCEMPDGTVKAAPEFEDVRKIADGTRESFRTVYLAAMTAAVK